MGAPIAGHYGQLPALRQDYPSPKPDRMTSKNGNWLTVDPRRTAFQWQLRKIEFWAQRLELKSAPLTFNPSWAAVFPPCRSPLNLFHHPTASLKQKKTKYETSIYPPSFAFDGLESNACIVWGFYCRRRVKIQWLRVENYRRNKLLRLMNRRRRKKSWEDRVGGDESTWNVSVSSSRWRRESIWIQYSTWMNRNGQRIYKIVLFL